MAFNFYHFASKSESCPLLYLLKEQFSLFRIFSQRVYYKLFKFILAPRMVFSAHA